MEVFELTQKAWATIKKFTSKEADREPLQGIEFSRVSEKAIRLTATDGVVMISGVFSEESILFVLEKEHAKSGAFNEKSGVYYLEPVAVKNRISISKFLSKTTDIQYPNASKGFNDTFERIEVGRTGVYNPTLASLLNSAVVNVFSPKDYFVPKYQGGEGNVMKLICWFADDTCDSFIGVMPMRDYSHDLGHTQNLGKRIAVNVETGKKGVSLSGCKTALYKKRATTTKKLSGSDLDYLTGELRKIKNKECQYKAKIGSGKWQNMFSRLGLIRILREVDSASLKNKNKTENIKFRGNDNETKNLVYSRKVEKDFERSLTELFDYGK